MKANGLRLRADQLFVLLTTLPIYLSPQGTWEYGSSFEAPQPLSPSLPWGESPLADQLREAREGREDLPSRVPGGRGFSIECADNRIDDFVVRGTVLYRTC